MEENSLQVQLFHFQVLFPDAGWFHSVNQRQSGWILGFSSPSALSLLSLIVVHCDVRPEWRD